MPQTKILVVEDEALIANDLAGRLQDNGYEVVGIAASGEDALEKLGSLAPDLVLMDIRLDGKMDGIDTAELVRSDFGLPVIFLTSHADQNTLNRAKLTEPFGYLVKPFRQVNLASSIEMALHKHAAEKRVRQQLGWLTNILLSSPDPTIVTDPEGVIQFGNVEAAMLIECSAEEWAGRKFHDVVHLYDPVTEAAAEDFVGSALQDRTAFAFPRGLCFRNRDGMEIMIEGEVAAGLFGQHENVGAVITFRDISRPRGRHAA
jgi:PAS domain S-box-containing protein